MKIVGSIIGSCIIVVVGAAVWFSGVINHPSEPKEPAYNLVVAEGSGVTDIGRKLKAAGYVGSVNHWKWYIALSGLRASLLPGEYTLTSGQSIREIAKLISTPPSGPNEVTVKLLEGWTAADMADVLGRAEVVDQPTFLTAVGATNSLTVVPKMYAFLADKPASANLEGFLFPDTYRFFVKSTPAQVLQKLLDNFDTKLTAQMRQQIQSQGRSIYSTIILASILERELQKPPDMARAADVYLRRIQAGIPLQADATVLYALGSHKTTITAEDILVDSPYNTYKVPGLPPGPIGNPGLSALRAAINPEPNDDWFYLSAPDGRTIWAKTLEEHNQNKAQYLR